MAPNPASSCRRTPDRRSVPPGVRQGVAEDAGEVLSLTGTENTPLTGPAKTLLITKDTDLPDPPARPRTSTTPAASDSSSPSR